MDAGNRAAALNTTAESKQNIPLKDGKKRTLEDVFWEWIGKRLVNPTEESLP